MRSLVSAATIGCLAVGVAYAGQSPEESTTSIVAGYERLHSAAEDSPEAGATLLGELNCLSCHTASAGVAAYVDTKPAPDLRGIGGRATPGWIQEFLLDPQAARPGTTRPRPSTTCDTPWRSWPWRPSSRARASPISFSAFEPLSAPGASMISQSSLRG